MPDLGVAAEEACSSCGQALIIWEGDQEESCEGCQMPPDRCPCDPLPLTPVRSVRSVSNEPSGPPKNSHTHESNKGLNQGNAEKPDLLAAIRDGAWLNEQKFPLLSYAIPGLLPEGFTLLVGPPKAGKSWLLLGWLLAVAAGGRALSAIDCDSPRRVLNCALEDGDRRMQDRCRTLTEGEDIPAEYSYLTRVGHMQLMPTISQYLDAYPETGVIAIDTLGRVMPPAMAGESAYGRDYRVGAAIKAVADSRPGLSVVAVHHDRKAATDDFVDSVSGTNGLAGSADTIIVLSRKRQSMEALLQVTGRDVPEAEYALKLRNGTWILDGRSLGEAAHRARLRKEQGDLSEKSRQIIEYVAQYPKGVRAKQVTEQFGNDAHTYLKRLADAGRLIKAERGLYELPPDGDSLPLYESEED